MRNPRLYFFYIFLICYVNKKRVFDMKEQKKEIAMKKFCFCLIGCLLATSPMFALLPPLYSSLEEYRQLLNSKELITRLESGQAILSIEKVEGGFEVKTPKYSMRVDIIPLPQSHPGPAQFHLEFHQPVARD